MNAKINEEILIGNLGRMESFVIVYPDRRHIFIHERLTEAERNEFVEWARRAHANPAEAETVIPLVDVVRALFAPDSAKRHQETPGGERGYSIPVGAQKGG